MTALNQKVSDKVDESFVLIATKIMAFNTVPPVLDMAAVIALLDQLSDEASAYQDRLAEDTIRVLPEKIDEVQKELDDLKNTTADGFLAAVTKWKDFLTTEIASANV